MLFLNVWLARAADHEQFAGNVKATRVGSCLGAQHQEIAKELIQRLIERYAAVRTATVRIPSRIR